MAIRDHAWHQEIDLRRAVLILIAFFCGAAVPIQLLTVSFGYAQWVKGISMAKEAAPVAHSFAAAVYIPWVLIPALIVLAAVIIYGHRHYPDVARRTLVGAGAGIVATALGLDGVRLTGVVHGWLPADSAPMFGMLVTGSESFAINFPVGLATHYLFGADFGIFFAFVWGKRRDYARAALSGVAWGLLVELGMMTLPPMAPSVGLFGISFKWPQFFLATLVAHLVWGVVLGLLTQHFLKEEDRGGLIAFLRGPSPPERQADTVPGRS